MKTATAILLINFIELPPPQCLLRCNFYRYCICLTKLRGSEVQFQNYLKATSGYSTSCEGVNYSCVYLIKTKSCKAFIQHKQSYLLLLSNSLIEGRLVEIGPWNNYNTKEINNLHKMLKSKFRLQVFMTIMARERKQSTLILCVIRFNSRRTTRTGTDVLLCCAHRTILGYSVGPAGNINRKWSSQQ